MELAPLFTIAISTSNDITITTHSLLTPSTLLYPLKRNSTQVRKTSRFFFSKTDWYSHYGGFVIKLSVESPSLAAPSWASGETWRKSWSTGHCAAHTCCCWSVDSSWQVAAAGIATIPFPESSFIASGSWVSTYVCLRAPGFCRTLISLISETKTNKQQKPWCKSPVCPCGAPLTPLGSSLFFISSTLHPSSLPYFFCYEIQVPT